MKLSNSTLAIFLVAILAVFLIGECSEPIQNNREKTKSTSQQENGKCEVAVRFLWPEDFPIQSRYSVTKSMGEKLKIAIASGKYPPMGGGTSGKRERYIFLFANRCDQKIHMTEEIINEYFHGKIANFPKYRIEGIE